MARGRAARIVAALAAALLFVYIVLWVGLPGSFRTGNDFAPTYVAGRLVLAGHGSAIYDQVRIAALERAAAPSGYQVNLPYISPPAAALVAAPLSALSFAAAESTWSLIQLVAIVAAGGLIALCVRWPVRTPTVFRVAVGAAAIGAPTVGALLLFGESDGLFTLAVAAGYLLFTRGHPIGAGVALGLAAGLAKPHLLVGVLAFLLFRRALTVVIACVATAGVVNLAAIAVLGQATAAGFVTAVVHSGVDHPPSGLLGAAGLLASWFGNGTAVRVAGIVVSALALVLCARLGVISRRAPQRTPALLAAALALSLLASPHLLVTDMVALIPPFIWLYAVILDAPRSARRVGPHEALLVAAWAWIAVATVMDAGSAAVGFPGRLMPWGLVMFALAGWLVAAGAPPVADRIQRVSAGPREPRVPSERPHALPPR